MASKALTSKGSIKKIKDKDQIMDQRRNSTAADKRAFLQKRESKLDHKFEQKREVASREPTKSRQEDKTKQALSKSPMKRRQSLASLGRNFSK